MSCLCFIIFSASKSISAPALGTEDTPGRVGNAGRTLKTKKKTNMWSIFQDTNTREYLALFVLLEWPTWV